MNLSTKANKLIENRLMVAKGRVSGEGWWSFEISRYKLLNIEQKNNKGPIV